MMCPHCGYKDIIYNIDGRQPSYNKVFYRLPIAMGLTPRIKGDTVCKFATFAHVYGYPDCTKTFIKEV